MTTPDTAIYLAEQEVGYCEKSKIAYLSGKEILYKKTEGAGSDNITKYGYEMHQIYPVTMDEFSYWCDSFVDWIFYKAYGIATAKSLLGGNFDDYTVASANMYKSKGGWITSNPVPGDQIFFKNAKRICHTGLVYKVDKRYVYTIEGNTSNKKSVIRNGGCVAKKSYALNNKSIAGYGRPKYDIPATCVFGDNNSDVKLLQNKLLLKGYKLPKYGADGDFGNETLIALKKFRTDNGLCVSSICDYRCWEKLLK